MLLIISILGWLILAHAARLSVAVVAIGYGVVLALQIRRTERAMLTVGSTGKHSLADFDRKPTRGQRRAMRTSLKLALRQTELTSLFPGIAQWAQQLVRPEIR